MTACTRVFSSAPSGRLSFWKKCRMCVYTVFGVTTSRAAIAVSQAFCQLTTTGLRPPWDSADVDGLGDRADVAVLHAGVGAGSPDVLVAARAPGPFDPQVEDGRRRAGELVGRAPDAGHRAVVEVGLEPELGGAGRRCLWIER